MVQERMAARASLSLSMLLLLSAGPALAEDRGCDIETTSHARIAPAGRGSGPTLSVGPQTPCATIPNGWENAIGPIGVEVTPQQRDGLDPPSDEGARARARP
jgi:hypothetical protein